MQGNLLGRFDAGKEKKASGKIREKRLGFWMRFVGWVDGDNSRWNGLICEGDNLIWGLRYESKRNKTTEENPEESA